MHGLYIWCRICYKHRLEWFLNLVTDVVQFNFLKFLFYNILTFYWSVLLWSHHHKLTRSLPECVGHQHHWDAAHTPHPSGPRTQLLRILLRDRQLSWKSLPTCQIGKNSLLITVECNLCGHCKTVGGGDVLLDAGCHLRNASIVSEQINHRKYDETLNCGELETDSHILTGV